MRTVGVAVALCLLLSGCGGSDGAKNAASPAKETATAAVTPTAKPTLADPTGVPAPEDLVDFQCYADAKGTWNSSGVLKNDSGKSVTYQVSVFVGQANGKDAKARTKQYVVNASSSARVALANLPAVDGSTQCYVQVLAKRVAG